MSVTVPPVIGIGILAVGTYLPPEVRTNAYWPRAVSERWLAERAAARASAAAPPTPTTPAMARVMAVMAEQADDPFRGVVERHVLAPDRTATDMEEAAARDAIERAGIDPAAIDLLLVHTAVPESLMSNSACPLHLRLGLAPACPALEVAAAAYSFLGQLALAEAMVAAGRAHLALLVQSSLASRLVAADDPLSPVFGDGATAVVVGPVAPPHGLIASVHRTDGRHPRTLVAGVPGGRWYDNGRAVLYNADPVSDRQVFLETVDRAGEVIEAVLAASRRSAAEVALFASHQGTPWLRRLAQDHAGLVAARSVDTFARTGYLFSASVPLGLAIAERDGLVGTGDLVVMFAGGTGMTYGAATMQWSGS